MTLDVFVVPLAVLAALGVTLVRGEAGQAISNTRTAVEFSGPTMGATFSVKIVLDKDELETSGLGDVDRAIRASSIASTT